jgi:serine/threonine protein phosphatase PrpC
VITRAVGSAEDLLIDEVMHPLQAGDMFLLCSDGLNKTVPDEEISPPAEHSNHNCQEAVKAFIHLALMRDASDNVTTVVVNIDSDPCGIAWRGSRSERRWKSDSTGLVFGVSPWGGDYRRPRRYNGNG